MTLDAHLFRREFGRIVAALTRIVGLAAAEDVAQDACVRALEVWKLSGVPDNPAAWLTATAKRRAIDMLRRERTARAFAEAHHPETNDAAATIDHAFSSVRDEQLRMMFTCCAPSLTEEVQVALILNILCGFGAAEIAAAFLASRAAIEKRIARGKHELANAWLDFDEKLIPARLEAVQRALYVLFNEGYHGTAATRRELCDEALRLVILLCELPTPATHALAALLHLSAGRLAARGELELFAHLDRSRWDHALVEQGLAWFQRAATGTELSAYHVEAAIAVTHATARSADETDWAAIAALYDRLIAIAPSPVVELNRAIAIGQRDPTAGLAALRAIAERDRFERYPFYPAAEAELELRRGNLVIAARGFRRALMLARNDAERHFLETRIAHVENRSSAPT